MAPTPPPGLKIFQIGFNKCGTTAIAQVLRASGLRVADWEDGALARSIATAAETGGVPLAEWPDEHVFTDLECVGTEQVVEGFRQFRALDAAYPEARFLLNTRNGEAWIRSRLRHLGGDYARRHRTVRGAADLDALADLWRHDWHAHHLEVLEYFSGPRRARLAIWDIDAPDFDAIERVLGLRLARHRWRRINRSARFLPSLTLPRPLQRLFR